MKLAQNNNNVSMELPSTKLRRYLCQVQVLRDGGGFIVRIWKVSKSCPQTQRNANVGQTRIGSMSAFCRTKTRKRYAGRGSSDAHNGHNN